MIIYRRHFDKIGVLIANTTTLYALKFHNLVDTDPIVFEVPAGTDR